MGTPDKVESARPHRLLSWGVLFTLSLVAALAVQLVILPYLLPQYHAGNGLLTSGDWLARHASAARMAAQVRAQGWSAWQLQPGGDGSVGIAAAVYALTTAKPWTLLPLFAALHATATLALVLILTPLVGSHKSAVIASFPFFACPTTLLWTTQLLKDGYSVAGFMLFLLGWARLTTLDLWRAPRLRDTLPPFAAIIGGGLLIWLVRAYVLQMLQGITACLAVVLWLALLGQRIHRRLRWKAVTMGAVAMMGVVFLLSTARYLGGVTVNFETSAIEGISLETTEGIALETIASPSTLPQVDFTWAPSSFLPTPVDQALRALARAREEWVVGFAGAASNVDEDVRFGSAGDVLRYAPRALEVALFAPFPSQWRARGTSTPATAMRCENAMEMVVIYVLLAFLPVAIWRWRRCTQLWTVVLLCVALLVALGASVINLGTLHRVRYPYLMTLACLGLAGGLPLLLDFRSRRSGRRWEKKGRAT